MRPADFELRATAWNLVCEVGSSTGIRTGWYGFLVDDGLRHTKALLIEIIAISKAVYLHAYAAPGNLPNTTLEKRRWVHLGPFTLEVAIVYPGVLRELHFEFREASALMLGS